MTYQEFFFWPPMTTRQLRATVSRSKQEFKGRVIEMIKPLPPYRLPRMTILFVLLLSDFTTRKL